VTVDPNNHLTVYAATGENDRCGDCGLSQGVLKSADGGATWTLLGQATFATSDTQGSAIVVDRTNSNRVLVGTSTGVYISTNGGTSWTASNLNTFGSLGNTTPPRVDSLFQDPSSLRIWAAVAKRCQDKAFIAYSDTGGSSWAVPYVTPGPIARIGLDEGADGTLYAAEASCPDANGNNYGDLVAILKSTSAFATTSTIAPASLTNYFRAAPAAPGQGFYDNVVAVDRSNSKHVVFGGVTMLATTDGGASFTDIARPYNGGPVHPDFHAVAFTAANTFYTANDGGVWKTANLGGSGRVADWTNLNATLGITTFFSGTALDATHLIGGAQDVGSSGLVPGGPTPPAWKPLLNGDGAWTAMDPTPGSNVIYGEHPFGFIYKGISSETVIDPRQPGTNWVPAGPCWFTTDPACNDPSGFVAPFLMDPANPSHLWSATNKIYESRSGGTPGGAAGWPGAPSRDLTTGTSILSGGDWISSLSYDRGSGVLASASYGGAVFVKNGPTATADFNWVNATGNLPAATASTLGNDAWVTDVWVGGLQRSGVGNFNDMWVTMSGNGIGHVWHATSTWSGQGPWIDLSGTGSTGLGNLVVDSIAVTSSAVVVGTDAGVMVCGGCLPPGITPPGWYPTPSWYSLGAGLPNAKVDALRLSNDGSLLVAWTHGRGAWTIPVQAMANVSSTITFGNQTVTETSPLTTLTPTSAGLSSLSFTAPPSITGLNPGDFAVEPSNCLPGYGPYRFGENCTLRLTFTPSASGARTATLSLYDNASDSPQTIALSGNGIRPSVGLSASSLAFGDVGVQTASDMTVSAANSGPGNLDVTSASVVGPNASSFSASFNCARQSVPPNSSCTVTATFRPGSAGTATATLQIFDNAADSPQQVSLSGRGVVPSVTISPSSLSFGNQAINGQSAEHTITLTNQGPGNLGVGYISPGNSATGGANPYDFFVGSNTCNAVYVAPGSACTIGISFTPQDLGSRTATLTITSNATGTPKVISFDGTGKGARVSLPYSLAFGDVTAGFRATRSMTVQNTGNAPLSGLALGLYGQNPGEFDTNVGTCAGSIAPSASCSITIGFTPKARGERTAFLQLTSTSPTIGLPRNVVLDGLGDAMQTAPSSPSSVHQRLVAPTSGGGFHGWIPTQALNKAARIASNPPVPASAAPTEPSATQVIPAMEDLMARITAFLSGF
jgi:hypothetical protein